MGILVSILMIILGALAAETWLTAKAPASSDTITRLRPYEDVLGIIGLVIGVISFLWWLSIVRFIAIIPFYTILALVATLVLIALGILFGTGFLHKQMAGSPFLVKMDGWRAKLLPQQQNLGIASIAIGLIYLVMFFAH